MNIKLEEGKYYLTRDGRKIGPCKYDAPDSEHPYNVSWEAGPYYYYENGKSCLDVSNDDIVAEWKQETPMSNNTEYKIWRDLTDAEKGALLLAHHEGKVIQVSIGGIKWEIEPNPLFMNTLHYRIKPEPVVETRNIFANCGDDRFIGNITYKDGKPDCGSIRMEEL